MLGAILYTSVGHAGSSVYIAIMSLFNLPYPVIRPTALTLNILVSSFTSLRYFRAKLIDFRLLMPLCIGAIPMAFLGGHLQLPINIFKTILGLILTFAGLGFFFKPRFKTNLQIVRPKVALLFITGAIIGFISGLTGTGGGIFLSPIVLAFGWTAVRSASGTAALFIFLNSVSGLLGNISSISKIPNTIPLFAFSVLIGAMIGTQFGIKNFSNTAIKRALGAVLIIAGLKLFFRL